MFATSVACNSPAEDVAFKQIMSEGSSAAVPGFHSAIDGVKWKAPAFISSKIELDGSGSMVVVSQWGQRQATVTGDYLRLPSHDFHLLHMRTGHKQCTQQFKPS